MTTNGAAMFVKWSNREYRHDRRGWKTREPHRTVIAQLVESRRVDGKTRQRIVAHLGTCHEPIEQTHHRQWFYQRCTTVLDGLTLSSDERAKIDAALAIRIPRPTVEEIEQERRGVEALMASFRPDPYAALERAWSAARTADRARFIGGLVRGWNAASPATREQFIEDISRADRVRFVATLRALPRSAGG
jgi:hypothetical protein